MAMILSNILCVRHGENVKLLSHKNEILDVFFGVLSFVTNVNMIFVFYLLTLNYLAVSGMTLEHMRPEMKRFNGEDPAPGRSPGPPLSTVVENPTIILTADELTEPDETTTMQRIEKSTQLKYDFSECDFDGSNVQTLPSWNDEFFQLNISHTIFRTDEPLVEGIVYQVSIVVKSPIQFLVTSLTSNDGTMRGQFDIDVNQHGQLCPPFSRASIRGANNLRVNWTTSGTNLGRYNVTFRTWYRLEGLPQVYEVNQEFSVITDCIFHLSHQEANLSSFDLPPRYHDCQIYFPNHSENHGLVVDLTRLNVPCTNGGFMQFFSKNVLDSHAYRHQNHLCGKLEELPEPERHIYFPSLNIPFLHLHGGPKFALLYRLVDYCYNVTLTNRNGSFTIEPTSTLQCSYKIHLPYGYRIAIRLQLGPISHGNQSGSVQQYHMQQDLLNVNNRKDFDQHDRQCNDGLLVTLYDAGAVWFHCARANDPQRNIQIVTRENHVVLTVRVAMMLMADETRRRVGLKLWYHEEPIVEVVRQCDYGWIGVHQFCVSILNGKRMSWLQAESECVQHGGHLMSIHSDFSQQMVDKLLLNSPGYNEHNAYWIGASDKNYEGDFRWSDGLPFSYTNWFPGWSQHAFYNRQPNDDGFSDQDCVEVRRLYHLPTSSYQLSHSFYWNDRDCSTLNYFICERLNSDKPLDDTWTSECNHSIILSRQHPRDSVTSPGFPRQYPDNINCDIEINAPSGYRIILEFDELVLENESSCSYDYLEIVETYAVSDDFNDNLGFSSTTTTYTSTSTTVMTTPSSSENRRRFCGDWSSKLKLLRHVSQSSRLKLRFVSDYSHHFGGFKARVSMENAMECADERLQLFNNSCYLFVSYPEVTWLTAQQICKGMKAQLTSILSPEEERFINSNIRKTSEYNTNAIYWIGAKLNDNAKFEWADGSLNSYTGWLPGQNPQDNDFKKITRNLCVGIQWTLSPTPMLPSGLYWQSQRCGNIGGYICKRRNQIVGNNKNFNRTLNASEGRLTSPNYPSNYFNNLDYWIRIIGAERTRLVIQFSRLDIEPQMECLYDYIELQTYPIVPNEKVVQWCGTHDTEMERFNFISDTNEALLHFHSDFSISGNGFSMSWQAIDVAGCPEQTLTAQEGSVTSPNYPYFLLSKLNCQFKILAPIGKRIWLEFTNFDIGSQIETSKFMDNMDETILKLDLGDGIQFSPFQTHGHINDGAYVSNGKHIEIRLQTAQRPTGMGFRAIYKTIQTVREERTIDLTNVTYGSLLHLNYPLPIPSNIDYTQHLIAPLGNVIHLELYRVHFSDNGICEDGRIEVFDNYADKDGTKWYLCADNTEAGEIAMNPVTITSYLNTIHVRQVSESAGCALNGTVRVQNDVNYKIKLLRLEDTTSVESCKPNPCQNFGKCVTNGKKRFCQCEGHYTGLFCALTVCELEPCVFGRCELTKTGYRCHCQTGYAGTTCEQRQKPCESNPCDGRGECIDRGESFHCRCHAWWEGTRCERRMMNIPFKPLSERMLHEPFWLGLITVTVVLAIIGLVWCAKRHFPEKLEKLLAEEADRNRGVSSLRGSSIREQLAAAAAAGTPAAVMVMPSPQQGGCPRSLFGRLGIRKPSLLSLTSPHGSGHSSAAATARTFSLDDLLKPPPRRTPSPRKKRNNSTPTKKSIAEKKQILQQLIQPTTSQRSRKVSLSELIQLSEQKNKEIDKDKENSEQNNDNQLINETNFGGTAPGASSVVTPTLDDPKLEKKVTFAKLLNKVSAEMSSSSDIELSLLKPKERYRFGVRPASTPPSPAAEIRSPHSTSSNQGSDSFSSLEVSAPCGSGSITDLLNARRFGRTLNSRGAVKPTSADSILAMFRNFSSTSAAANMSVSRCVSPSTTPTASSPQDDIVGDDDSSTSSMVTPVSFSSGQLDSPLSQRTGSHNIEVSVVDSHNSYKMNTSNSNLLAPPTILLEIPSAINKCLSPIHELPTPLPTPMPSPMPTPMRQRSPICSSIEDIEMDLSDDRISVEIPCISMVHSEGEDEELATDIAIDPQAEDGLLQEEAAAMIQSCATPLRPKLRLPTIGVTSVTIKDLSKQNEGTSSTSSSEPPPLVIPTLIIQQPSPTRRSPPTTLLFPGSPPPQRAHDNDEKLYGTSSRLKRNLLKDFDKPTSLDLPCAPPMITITCNLSEVDSDAESISPAAKNLGGHLGVASGNVGMCYLSPFSMCSRNDRTASESNLSSSGYSSMASPGPSRCGSNNPLCPSEMEDPGSHGGGSHFHSVTPRRPSPLLKSLSKNNDGGDGGNSKQGSRCRGRSDSETLSDDPLLESNDEGIGTDHIDEKIEDGELKSAKDLQVFITKEDDVHIINTLVPPIININDDLDYDKMTFSTPTSKIPTIPYQLPSIVVQRDVDIISEAAYRSPTGSRSDSPNTLGRQSPQFRFKDSLNSDSDGFLQDNPLSDSQIIKMSVSPTLQQQHRKSTGRRREKKAARTTLKSPSPTKPSVSASLSQLLDIPGKDPQLRAPTPRKLSPKRRIRTQQRVSSSSSSESLHSNREYRISSSSPSPDTIRWPSLGEWPIEKKPHMSADASGEETAEVKIGGAKLSKTLSEEISRPSKKISRLRTISHQIRFLRRIEKSLKRRERLFSLSDSCGDDDDDTELVTSPLLNSPKGSRPEIRKSNSISKLQGTSTTALGNSNTTRNRQGRSHSRHKRAGSQLLIPQDDRTWSRVPIGGNNGYSD